MKNNMMLYCLKLKKEIIDYILFFTNEVIIESNAKSK